MHSPRCDKPKKTRSAQPTLTTVRFIGSPQSVAFGFSTSALLVGRKDGIDICRRPVGIRTRSTCAVDRKPVTPLHGLCTTHRQRTQSADRDVMASTEIRFGEEDVIGAGRRAHREKDSSRQRGAENCPQVVSMFQGFRSRAYPSRLLPRSDTGTALYAAEGCSNRHDFERGASTTVA